MLTDMREDHEQLLRSGNENSNIDETTKKIRIKRGMKYGCSLSPVLLDIFKMSDAAHGEVYEAF
jgi:hypothetical protein